VGLGLGRHGQHARRFFGLRSDLSLSRTTLVSYRRKCKLGRYSLHRSGRRRANLNPP
jgi:hypothetical protein